jgi:hypothetical protein
MKPTSRIGWRLLTLARGPVAAGQLSVFHRTLINPNPPSTPSGRQPGGMSAQPADTAIRLNSHGTALVSAQGMLPLLTGHTWEGSGVRRQTL